jgi:hypothetical protein
MWPRLAALARRPSTRLLAAAPAPALPPLLARACTAASPSLPTRSPLLAPPLASLVRALSTAPRPKNFMEARRVAANTSVYEARKVVFGHWPSEGATRGNFKSLRRVRKGFIETTMVHTSNMGARPKPNLKPPGHEVERQDYANFYERHPTYRKLLDLDRGAELEYRRRNGKSPPKKGAGKRKSKGK